MITIDNLIADETVKVNGEDTGLTPEELLFKLTEEYAENTPYGTRNELAKSFYEKAKEDTKLAFLPNYNMWIGRYQNGYWTKEQLDARVGRKDPIKNNIVMREAWEKLEKLAK